MRHILLSIAIISTFLFCEGQAQNIDFSKPVILHFSHDSDPAAFWISYFMIGSFGGYGSFIQTKAKTWD